MKNITINEVEEIAGVRIETINELKHGEHLYVVQVNVGGSPKECVSRQLQVLSNLFRDRGITNAIFVPVDSEGFGKLSITEISNCSKTIDKEADSITVKN